MTGKARWHAGWQSAFPHGIITSPMERTFPLFAELATTARAAVVVLVVS